MENKEIVGWFSRNPPLPAQVREMRMVLGPCRIVEHKQMFQSADNIIALARSMKLKHAVIVAPLSMIAKVVAKPSGVVWLWARMDPVHPEDVCSGIGKCKDFDPERDVVVPNSRTGMSRHHRFEHFYIIKKVELLLDPFK